MSGLITVATFVYPPVVPLSARSTIGVPEPGTWIDPRADPSETMSGPCTCLTAGPSSRHPVRSESVDTVYSEVSRKAIPLSVNIPSCGPMTTRISKVCP